MRLVRYELGGRVGTGVLEGNVVRDGEAVARLDELTLPAPCEPRTIVCVGGQWARAKSADTFCPLGPWIETEPPGPAQLSTRLNGREVQRSGIDRMIFGIGEILACVTRWFTLSPGDVVLTGSPAGAGPMRHGDRVTVEIDGIGALTSPVTTRTKELT